MLSHLDKELQETEKKIFKMADLAIEAVAKSIEALKTGNDDLALNVIENDKNLDFLEKDIDNDCIRILVTKQPAASDLRLVLMMLKSNTDLERIGDLAINISNETLRSGGNTPERPLKNIPKMSSYCVEMFNKVFQAIADKDTDLARQVIKMDEFVDSLNVRIYKDLFELMKESPDKYTAAFSLIFISKALERIGDHIKNIAERAIYYIEGEDIRHEKLED